MLRRLAAPKIVTPPVEGWFPERLHRQDLRQAVAQARAEHALARKRSASWKRWHRYLQKPYLAQLGASRRTDWGRAAAKRWARAKAKANKAWDEQWGGDFPEWGVTPEAEAERLERARSDLARGYEWPPPGFSPSDLPATLLLRERFAVYVDSGGRGWWLSASAYERQSAVPYQLPTDDEPYLWLFRSDLYATRERLTDREALALLTERENRRRSRVARAVAAMELADGLDSREQRAPIPDDVKVFVWQRDRGVCVRCGSNANLEFDHIIPLSMNGANTARNLQLLCSDCNHAKGGNLV